METNGGGDKRRPGNGQTDWKVGGEGKPKSNRQRAAEKPYEPDYPQSPRRPATDRENAFNALVWLLEGATGLLEELRHNDLGLPEDFWIHAYAARRESLLALRAILDEMIERSAQQAQQEEERQKRRQRRGSVDINF